MNGERGNGRKDEIHLSGGKRKKIRKEEWVFEVGGMRGIRGKEGRKVISRDGRVVMLQYRVVLDLSHHIT